MKQSPKSDNNWEINSQENTRYYNIISRVYPHFDISKIKYMRVKDYRLLFGYNWNIYTCELDSEAIFHIIMKSIKSSVNFHLDFYKIEEKIHWILKDYLWVVDDEKIKEIYFSSWYYICFYKKDIFMVPAFYKDELKNKNFKYTDVVNLSEIISENFPNTDISEVNNISLEFEWYMVFYVWDMKHFTSLKLFSVLQKEVLWAKARWEYDRE